MVKFRNGECFLGRTLILETETMELEVTLDVGPRIISCKKLGGENIFVQDVNDAVNKDCSAVYGEGKAWHIYGGHRIWLSPEDLSSYYPDNEEVSYVTTANGAIFTPKAWAIKDVQVKLIIDFKTPTTVDVGMSVTNLKEENQDICVWSLTVCKPNAKLTVPLSTKDTGLLANRNLVFWSYTDINDSRLKLLDDKFILTSSDKATKPFKLGTYLEEVYCEYEYKDTTFIKRIAKRDGKFPDFCSNFETYTSNFIHEVETLSPITSLAKGESIIHTENWEIR